MEPIHCLTPPRLGDEDIDVCTCCLRPTRLGGPRCEWDERRDLWLLHAYGHGSAGWTSAPGTAKHVVGLLLLRTLGELSADTMTPIQYYNAFVQAGRPVSPAVAQRPISVVGVGVIGLFVVRALHAVGFRRLSVFADRRDDLTSHRAGGLLAPAGSTPDADNEQTFWEIQLDSFDEWLLIARGGAGRVRSAMHPFPCYVHRYTPAVDQDMHGLWRYVEAGKLTWQHVVVDFGNDMRHQMTVFPDNVFMDTVNLMQELWEDVFEIHAGEGPKAVFLQRRIRSWDEMKASHHPEGPQDEWREQEGELPAIVFNCTGMGGLELEEKKEERGRLVGALGHTMRLLNQDGEQLRYSVSRYPEAPTLVVWLDENGREQRAEVKRALYMHFRAHEPGPHAQRGLLGGTFIQGYDELSFPAAQSAQEAELLKTRARLFFHGNVPVHPAVNRE